jgi:hypothetical protein
MGGVILTHRWTPAEFAATTAKLHATSCEIGRPLLIFVDQEGGSIRRLTWAPPVHSEGQLGRLGSAQTQREATAAASALRTAGVDVDLAPVADTLGPGGFLGDRSFGGTPSLVASLAATFIHAVQAGGIAATAKHFPGLGAARQSTDDHIVSLLKTPLEPFRSAIEAGVKLVMVSNASYPKLDPGGTPAVFSHPIVSGLLRRHRSARRMRRAVRLLRASICSSTRAAPQRTTATRSSSPTRNAARRRGRSSHARSRTSVRSRPGSDGAARGRAARASRRCGASAVAPSPSARGRSDGRAAARSPDARVCQSP